MKFLDDIKHIIKSQAGWMLIDSLIGIVIVSTALVAIVLAYTQATKGTITVTNRTQAVYLAQKTLENLKKQDGGSSIIAPSESTVLIGSINYDVKVDPHSVSAITEASQNPVKLSDYLKPYQVTVSWSDSTGGPVNKTVQMVGYYYVN